MRQIEGYKGLVRSCQSVGGEGADAVYLRYQGSLAGLARAVYARYTGWCGGGGRGESCVDVVYIVCIAGGRPREHPRYITPSPSPSPSPQAVVGGAGRALVPHPDMIPNCAPAVLRCHFLLGVEFLSRELSAAPGWLPLCLAAPANGRPPSPNVVAWWRRAGRGGAGAASLFRTCTCSATARGPPCITLYIQSI
jgi:hypothetical protein